MEVFEMFKIVFGLIISGFVLYFLISYAATYSTTQEDILRAQILKSFDQTVRDVSLYGGFNKNFTDFSRIKFGIETKLTEPNKFLALRTGLGDWEIKTPLVYSPGDTLWLERGEQDLGWWKFYYTVAVPETEIVLNPQTGGQDVEDLIAKLADAFTRTLVDGSKVRLKYCNGNTISDLPGSLPASTGQCTRQMKNNQRLVTILSAGSDCRDSDFYMGQGVCIEAPSASPSYLGIGRISFFNDTDTDANSLHFHIDNVAPLAAAIMGGSEKTIWGTTGKNMFLAMNAAFARDTGLAAKILGAKAGAMQGFLNAYPQSSKEVAKDCIQPYGRLKTALSDVKSFLSDADYFRDIYKMQILYSKISDAKTAYLGLIGSGCEYAI